jgi:hypothetical protein
MATSKKRVEFAICVANEGYDDLEVWKVYQLLPDAKPAGVGCIRVVDETGEDYLYPENRFVMVDLPKDVRTRLPRRPPSDGPNEVKQATAIRRRRTSAARPYSSRVTPSAIQNFPGSRPAPRARSCASNCT